MRNQGQVTVSRFHVQGNPRIRAARGLQGVHLRKQSLSISAWIRSTRPLLLGEG
jgi:hypothetical protein